MKPGKPKRSEFEYRRHGTLCLNPPFVVAIGKIVEYHLDQIWTAEDFAQHVAHTIEDSSSERWICIVDQLNIRKFEELVRMVAKHIGFIGDLGKKGNQVS